MSRAMTSLAAATLAVAFWSGADPAHGLSIEELNTALPGLREPPPDATSWNLLGKAAISFVEEDGVETLVTFIPPEVAALDGQTVKLLGFMVPIEAELPMKQFLLVELPSDCAFCLAAGTEPSRIIEVNSPEGFAYAEDQILVSGRLEVVENAEEGVVYRLHEAVLAE